MIGKIMSEVSHSIIGMLSAKPVDMETRASNPDFMALLTSSDEQYRLAPDAGNAEVSGPENPDGFLEQLAHIENQTNLTSSAVNATQAVPTEILKSSSDLDGEPLGSLASGAQSPGRETNVTSASTELETASDTDNAELGYKGTAVSAGDIDASIASSSSPVGSAKPESSLTNAIGVMPVPEKMTDRLIGSIANQHGFAVAISTPTSAQLERQMTTDEDTNVVVRPNIPGKLHSELSENHNRESFPTSSGKTAVKTGFESIVSKAELLERTTVDVERKPSLVNGTSALQLSSGKLAEEKAKPVAPQTDSPGSTVKSHASISSIRADMLQTSVDVSKPNLVPALATDAQNSVVRPKILDSIDLRLASKAEAQVSSIPSSQEIEFPNVLAGGDKRGIADIKNALVGTDTAASLETLVRDVPSSNLPTQATTHKTVNFDWNAPNFAGRFAAEVSGMTTIGDSKKFEINPRNLGRLEVAFVSRGAAEFIRIEAETDAARDVILQNAQAIQDMLKAQGRSDLTIRVDVKESGFSSLNGGDLNQAQQDSAGTNESEENVFSKNSENGVREAGRDAEFEPETSSDSSRYA